ncbi:MAG: LacI family DNA-binding transcriptional regulator [Actinopolymorphaceae bacterium]
MLHRTPGRRSEHTLGYYKRLRYAGPTGRIQRLRLNGSNRRDAMAVTLADVAEACGISASTVSRALADPEKVNPLTRDRVLKIAREMGYVPNHVARSLSSGRTGILGLVVPDIANPFFPPLIKAVQARAGYKGLQVLLADTDEHARDEIDRATMMSRQTDGMILASPRTPEDRLAALTDLGPVVFVNREVPGAPSVVIDEAEGMHQAVHHLTALGHKRLCYLAGPRRSWSNSQRSAAVAAACAEHGVDVVEFGPFEAQVQSGVHAADLVLASGATAVIAYDDLIALGVMARLTERGIHAGQEISLIGVDDSPLSQMAHPTLTSVHVPSGELGSVGVDLLLAQINDADTTEPDQPARVLLETRLVVRSSTGPAR